MAKVEYEIPVALQMRGIFPAWNGYPRIEQYMGTAGTPIVRVTPLAAKGGRKKK
jgi:hypothetical protein